MSLLLSGLNPAQQQAVISNFPVILCLAGAGSGKTTVLTRRIAHLHQEHRIGTSNMLALTFTRLAGKEMKERVIKLTGEQEGKKLFCNTFHAFAVYVLKEWGHKIGIEKNFTIYDQDDRTAILEKIIEEFGKRTTLKKVLTYLEFYNSCSTEPYPELQKIHEDIRVVQEYEFQLKQNNAVDLDALIIKMIQLWVENHDILANYQRMYSHVFVDEFQDTNDEQMLLIKMLSPKNLFIVGDDFQAIYGWRGAKVEYIIDFPNQFPDCEVVKLQDNYRSTNAIVHAANNLISYNKNQTVKKLIAHKDGIPVVIHHVVSEDLEYEFIKDSIKKLTSDGVAFKSIAVLTRTNRQIDRLKNYLDQKDVPSVKIAGSEDPFKKRDVKQAMAWLDFLYNKKDTVNLKKALRYPKQYITDQELISYEIDALANDSTLYEVIENKTTEFMTDLNTIESTLQNIEEYTPSNFFQVIVEILEIGNYYRAQNLTNRLKEFDQAYSYMQSWERTKMELGEDYGLSIFLRWLKHRDLQEKLIEEKDAVKLMTIHASKGLEFPVVFVAGLNQGVFPSKRTLDVEEERRLAYVAFTRAKDKLILTRSEHISQWNGEPVPALPSSYLEEIKANANESSTV